jgi:hypothetical protein
MPSRRENAIHDPHGPLGTDSLCQKARRAKINCYSVGAEKAQDKGIHHKEGPHGEAEGEEDHTKTHKEDRSIFDGITG